MNRRSFLTSLLAVVITPHIPKPKLRLEDLFKPSQAQINFLEGVPYHQTNASMGTWLGFDRATSPQFVSAWMHPSQKEAYLDLVKLTKYMNEIK